jgi:hypothetical protein
MVVGVSPWPSLLSPVLPGNGRDGETPPCVASSRATWSLRRLIYDAEQGHAVVSGWEQSMTGGTVYTCSHSYCLTHSLSVSLSRRKVGTDNENWYTKHKHSLPEESPLGVMLWGGRVVFYGAVTVVVQHVSKGESVGYSTTSADCQSKSQSNTRWSEWRAVPEAERVFCLHSLSHIQIYTPCIPVQHCPFKCLATLALTSANHVYVTVRYLPHAAMPQHYKPTDSV